MDNNELCERTRIRLIAAAVGHQQCTKTAANMIPLPGADRFIAIGTAAEVARLLEIAPVAPIQATSGVPAEPVAWIRFRTDGGYEGPIMHSAIEDVRKKSGAWTPLYAAPVHDAAAPSAEQATCTVETEMADRLRRIVANHPGATIQVSTKTLATAADECDRFYGGMMNWKANAQAKDRTIIDLRTAAKGTDGQGGAA